MQTLSEILYTNNLSKSYKESVRYTSVHSVSPCAYYISLLIYPPYFGRTSYYPVTMSSITLLPCLPLLCYHVSHYSVPCLEYPVTMSPITLLPCLLLLCLMSSTTLSHVFHYSVTMSLITLSPSRNAKPQKKS